jgi:adenylate cyclase
MAAIDFEGEGLLDGLEGGARDARLRLLSELAEDGVELAELRRAVAENRLALLPVERVLGGGAGRYTADEVAEKAELPREFLDRQRLALGLALQPDDAPVYTDADLEAARRVAELRAGGLPDEGILETARLLGMTMSQLAAANRTLVADTFLSADDDEYKIAQSLATAARAFVPLTAQSLAYTLNLHLREQIRHDVIAADGSRAVPGSAQEATVCFADLVAFTQLGEALAPEELGAVTGRLAELAAEVVEPPVRLVKLIGDAAMMVGPEPEPVLEAGLRLVEAVDDEGEDFPLLRAGVASGPALARGGDWYGRPVNIASRVTTIARPGSVLATETVHDALEGGYAWSFAGTRKLKGIDGSVKLFRCRRADGEQGG